MTIHCSCRLETQEKCAGDFAGEHMAISKLDGSRIVAADGQSVTETTESQTETSTYRSVTELAEDIGLSERSTRAALRRGEIPHIRIGRRFILPRAAIAEWLRTAGRAGENGPPVRTASRLAVLASPR
jgi:excisionase family DNA binding protein